MYLSTTAKYIDSRISGVSKCFNTSGAFGFLPVGTGSAILLRYLEHVHE